MTEASRPMAPPSTKPARQTRMTTYAARPLDKVMKKKMDQLLLDMVVMDLQPFSIVEDQGMY